MPIAVPPQMLVPPPTRMEVFKGIPIFFPMIIDIVNAKNILNTISGNALIPVPKISLKLKVAPVSIIAQFKNFLLANVVPDFLSESKVGSRLHNIIEIKRATIGAPITIRPNASVCQLSDFVAKKPIMKQIKIIWSFLYIFLFFSFIL